MIPERAGPVGDARGPQGRILCRPTRRVVGPACLALVLALATNAAGTLRAQPADAVAAQPAARTASAPTRAPATRGDTLETIRAQADLAFRLLARLARDGAPPADAPAAEATDADAPRTDADAAGNALVSPPAVGTALAVLHAGASGEARRELTEALGLEPGTGTPDALAAWVETLQALGAPGDPRRLELEEMMMARTPRIEPAGTPRLFVGASLWLDAPRRADPELAERLEVELEAEVETVELHEPEGRERIEAWVRDWTLGATEEVPALGSGGGGPEGEGRRAHALVLGSFFFEAGWAETFREELTEEAPFHREDGGTVTVPFLRRSGTWSYGEPDGARIVRLPYLEERYALYVALPPEGTPAAELAAGLDAERWGRWLEAMEERQGEVRLPRMDVEGDHDLAPALRALGLERALDPEGLAYDRILASGRPMGVVRVLHHGGLELDEKGTRAYAVAGFVLEEELLPDEEPFTFVADRPFLAVLRDDDSGAILLAAVIRHPLPSGRGGEGEGTEP